MDKDYQQLHDRILNEINQELNVEKHIEETSSEIAALLILSQKCEVEINGTPYLFSYRVVPQKNANIIVMMAANKIKYEIAAGKYSPFVIRAEANPNHSMSENLEMMAEAFVRKLTDNIKIEEIED